MLTIIVAGLATTAAAAAIINRLGNRKVAIVVKKITFTETRDFSTPTHLYRRMEADRQAHVADFRRRLHQS